jgi:hypothetical protein
MNESVTSYDTTPVLLQKHKAALYDDQGRLLELEYNGVQQAFRIRLQAVQRLFFFEAALQKTVFRNEYGVLMGQVVLAKAGAGAVRIDGKQYRFSLSGDGLKLSLLHTQSGNPISTYTLPEEAFHGLDAVHKQHLVHCLIFSFAWATN